MENDLEYFENISDRFLLQFLYHIIYISGDNNPVLKYLAKFVLPGIKCISVLFLGQMERVGKKYE